MIKIKEWLKNNKGIIIFLVAAFIFRLYLTPLGFHDDIYSNTAWGQWIFQNGIKGFYEADGWINSSPTQPPLISLLYGFNLWLYERLMFVFANLGIFIATYHLAPTKMIWFFDFAIWFGNSMYGVTPFKFGALISMKLVAIVADLTIALVIYCLAKSANKSRPALWSAIYLFSPFSWYLSGLWGQYDQLSFFFLLLTFIFLVKRFLFFSPLLLLISAELKPTSLIFIPLFLWIYLRSKPTIMEFIAGWLTAFIFFVFSIWIFTDRDLMNFIQGELIPRIFFKSEFRVSTNAFNFWRIFIGNAALNQDTILFLIPTKIWGYLIFLLLYIYSLKLLKIFSTENIFKALFLIGFGGWLFLTNMLDRYLFAGIVLLLIISIYQKKFLKYWIILSLIFWLNLYNQWWFPNNLDFLKEILIWQNYLISRILAVINVVLFLVILRKIFFIKKAQRFPLGD